MHGERLPGPILGTEANRLKWTDSALGAMSAKHLMFWQKMTQVVRSWMGGRPEKRRCSGQQWFSCSKRAPFYLQKTSSSLPSGKSGRSFDHLSQGHGRTRCRSSPRKEMMDVPSLAENTRASAGTGRFSGPVVLSCHQTRCRLFALWHGEFICQPWRVFTFAQI